jgi:hypothetical protein
MVKARTKTSPKFDGMINDLVLNTHLKQATIADKYKFTRSWVNQAFNKIQLLKLDIKILENSLGEERVVCYLCDNETELLFFKARDSQLITIVCDECNTRLNTEDKLYNDLIAKVPQKSDVDIMRKMLKMFFMAGLNSLDFLSEEEDFTEDQRQRMNQLGGVWFG